MPGEAPSDDRPPPREAAREGAARRLARPRWARDDAVLVTGATGFLGGLVAAELAATEPCRFVLLARARHDAAALAARIASEVERERGPERAAEARSRLDVWPLPDTAALLGLADALRGARVREVVHCAGSVDYFDRAVLEAANVDLTRALVELAEASGAERFVFLSTAFACGLVQDRVGEVLHPDPPEDPTEYTRSKRRAEAIVAAAAIPSLLLRPAVVVGDSRTGRYLGPTYGTYQMWAASERFHLDHDPARPLHFVAPARRAHLVHQDHFARSFAAAVRGLDAGIAHLVSDEDALPTARDVHVLWNRDVIRAPTLHLHERADLVPREELSRREQAYLDFAAVNVEIAAHGWSFARDALERLAAAEGDPSILPRCDLASFGRCQEAFIRGSRRIQRHLAARGALPQTSPTTTGA